MEALPVSTCIVTWSFGKNVGTCGGRLTFIPILNPAVEEMSCIFMLASLVLLGPFMPTSDTSFISVAIWLS